MDFDQLNPAGLLALYAALLILGAAICWAAETADGRNKGGHTCC